MKMGGATTGVLIQRTEGHKNKEKRGHAGHGVEKS